MDSGGRADPPLLSCAPACTPTPLATACSVPCSRRSSSWKGRQQPLPRSRQRLLCPWRLFQRAICPRQRAHVFLLILPSPLLVWTLRAEGAIVAGAQRPGRAVWLGTSYQFWVLESLLLAPVCKDAHLCFLDFALQMAGAVWERGPSSNVEGKGSMSLLYA